MDFYEGNDIELGPKGCGRFDRQRRECGGRAFQEKTDNQSKSVGARVPHWGWTVGYFRSTLGEIRQPR